MLGEDRTTRPKHVRRGLKRIKKNGFLVPNAPKLLQEKEPPICCDDSFRRNEKNKRKWSSPISQPGECN